jgi:hypothetical protein
MLILIGNPTVPNHTYKAVRLFSTDYNLFYSVWCNNDHELYDLAVSFLWHNVGRLTQLTKCSKDGPLPGEQSVDGRCPKG